MMMMMMVPTNDYDDDDDDVGDDNDDGDVTMMTMMTSESCRHRHVGSLKILIVRYTHGGGWSRKINARYLHTLMVYL